MKFPITFLEQTYSWVMDSHCTFTISSHTIPSLILGNCTPAEAETFRRFETTNFEAILESCLTATRINAIFGMPSDPINAAAIRLKEGLVTTVGQNHPRSADLNREQLNRVSEILDPFGDVFALSYDALLYHVIMISLDRYQQDNSIRPYSDYFWGEYDDQFLRFMRSQDYRRYKLIYYLHGALFIFFRRDSVTVKIRRSDGTELLELIEEQINLGNIPLFVSEGTPEDKRDAISRSEYLRFAYSHLKNRTNRLVVYGSSLSRPDGHIVDAIRNQQRHLALSIHVGEKTEEALRTEIAACHRKLPNQPLYFYDSNTLFVLN
jgi:hypothetical protein